MPGVPPHVLGQGVGVLAQLVGLEIHLGLEHDELLLEALAVQTEEMVLLKMLLERVVILVVVRLPRVAPVTDKAPLVLVPAMVVELVGVVEARAAEAAQWVSLETGLVNGSRLVVAFAHVVLQFLVGEQLVLVRKDLLVTSAEVTHLLVVDAPHMAVEIWPAQSSKVAGIVGAVVAEEENGVANYVFVRIPDADIVVCAADVSSRVVFESLRIVVGEDDERRLCLEHGEERSVYTFRYHK
jgi:hypothetical protein